MPQPETRSVPATLHEPPAQVPATATATTVSPPELAAAPVPPLRGESRYRKVRSHARGGLGEVFVAADDELQRAIALKEIQPRHADDPNCRQRFVQEALVTGRLEHPGIVPIYGLGAYADGRPYYAMRFIKGESFDVAIDRFHAADQGPRDPGERSLTLRGLLRRFVDVCNAIGFAHSKGVLHRDLKPANIMLGLFGETLVVDWGLAKIVGAAENAGTVAVTPEPTDRNATREGVIIGTLAFMSPEQAQGSKTLGLASDVYALGAVLYNLLTGRPPVEGPLMQVLPVVQSGKIPPARSVKPSTPPALEAICRQAMALQPAERYSSARELAADVEHWLADEPVSAYPEPLRMRVRRWGRRHRGLVSATVALVLTATVALAVGLVLVNAERQQTAAARDEEQKAKEAEQTANTDLRAALEREQAAVVREHTAVVRWRTAHKTAGEQRQLALATIHNLLGSIRTDLSNVPNSQEAKQKLFQTALESLSKVARAADTERQADHETIAVHFDLGELFLLLDEGGLAEAQRQYDLAYTLAKQRLAADPSNSEAQRDLAVAHKNLGDVQMRLGNTRAALEAYRDSSTLSQTLVDANPANTEAEHDLAVALDKLGDAHLALKNLPAALASYRAGLTISEKRAAAAPGDPVIQRDLLVNCFKLGATAENARDYREAIVWYQKGLAVAKRFHTPEIFQNEVRILEQRLAACRKQIP